MLLSSFSQLGQFLCPCLRHILFAFSPYSGCNLCSKLRLTWRGLRLICRIFQWWGATGTTINCTTTTTVKNFICDCWIVPWVSNHNLRCSFWFRFIYVVRLNCCVRALCWLLLLLLLLYWLVGLHWSVIHWCRRNSLVIILLLWNEWLCKLCTCWWHLVRWMHIRHVGSHHLLLAIRIL